MKKMKEHLKEAKKEAKTELISQRIERVGKSFKKLVKIRDVKL